MNTDTKRWRPDMTNIELRYYNSVIDMEKSLRELVDVVKSIRDSRIEVDSRIDIPDKAKDKQ